ERDRAARLRTARIAASAARQARQSQPKGKESAHGGELYGRNMNATEVTEVQDRGPAAYLAEFIGTLLLALFVTTPSAQNPNPFIDFSVIGLVHVFLLFGLIQTLAVISGAHFNPAVTAVMVVLRQISVIDAAIYIIAQLGGAVA